MAGQGKKPRAETPRAPRPASDLEAMLRVHLLYEIEMFFNSALTLFFYQRDPSDMRNNVCYNALVESFAVHTRALLHFFYPPRDPQTSDVIADDFMPQGKSWAAVRPPKPQIHLPEGERWRVAKEIVHLTYDRIGREKSKEWHNDRICWHMMPVIEAFIRELPPSNERERFCSRVSAAIDSVRRVVAPHVSEWQ